MSVNDSDCFRLLFLSNPYPARCYTKKKNADFLPSILQWIRAVFSETVWKTLSMEQRGSSMAIYDSSFYAFLSFISRDAMPCILAFYEGYFTARMIRYSSTRTKNQTSSAIQKISRRNTNLAAHLEQKWYQSRSLKSQRRAGILPRYLYCS